MNTDYRGFWAAPLWVIGDYLTVIRGEALAAEKPVRPEFTSDGKQKVTYGSNLPPEIQSLSL